MNNKLPSKPRRIGRSLNTPLDKQVPTRLLRVFNIPRNTDSLIFTDFCKTYGDVFAVNQTKVESLGYAYVAFYDLRCAMSAYEELPKLQWCGGIRTEYVQEEEFQRVCLNSGLESVSLCLRSQVLITADDDRLCNSTVSRKAGAYGDLRGIEQLNHFEMSCDYYDIRSAANFATSFPSGKLGGVMTWVRLIEVSIGPDLVPGLDTTSSRSTGATTTSSSTTTTTTSSSGISSTRTGSTCATRVSSGASYQSAVETSLRKSTLTNEVESLSDKLKHGSLDYNASENYTDLGVVTKSDVPRNNAVDLRRIAKGLDTRTTLMLRNIPNKVDQQMLKDYIDVTNAHTYDFLCTSFDTPPDTPPLANKLDLRIDFANKCNVGYAFISFIAPEHIITFAKARAGTKWNRFNSEKVCDLSYANIQGKECLIEKFRNSSVMDQNPAYRPRVFCSEGENAGKEQEFPAPNNINRKLRSIVSVQRVGLFPPQESRNKNSKHKKKKN